jgi:hypothetical protein
MLKLDKREAVKTYIFIFSLMLLVFVAMLINSFKLLNSLILLMSLIASSTLIFVLYLFRKNPKEVPNILSLLLVITTLFVILFLIIVSFPSEAKGINKDHLITEFNFYIVNNEIENKDLVSYISKANKIWNKYNITIHIENIYNVEINISDEERYFLYTNVSEKNSEEENKRICEEEYMPLINQITSNNSNRSIIFIEGDGSSGRGSLCGHSFAIFNREKFYFIDLTGWNLAHEIGHIFGLIHPENIYKINLMTDKHKLFWKSSFLTQPQIENVKSTIQKRFYEL